MVDASGRSIVDPRKSNRSWKPGFHYTKFCSAYAVRRGRVNTGANSNRRNGVNIRSNPNYILKQIVNAVKKKPVAKAKKPALRKRKVKNTKRL